jgi:tetrahydromethanopterin S-methyltransferase subunit C
MVDIMNMLSNMLQNIINAIPSVIAAIVVVIIGYVVGSVVGKAVNKIVEKVGIEKTFDQTSSGKAFRASGLDLSNLVGGIVKAFIIVFQ